MGNTGVCASCKSKDVEAEAVGDEAPLQVSGEDDPAASSLASPAAVADAEEVSPTSQGKEWVLRPGGNLTVMMFGMTGAGKSALGNLIAGFDAFDYGDDTVSVTNLDSVMRYEADNGSLVLLDTIGLGDTEIDQDKVVASIRDVALSAPGGVDVLLFVMRNARITDDAIARLIYATEYLWGSQCLLNLYIVITHASRYMTSKEEAKAWIDRQVEINWRFRHIYKIVGENPNRFIFIDNPDPKSGEPNVEERRRESRDAVMRMMCLHPRDAIPPFTFSVMKRAQELTEERRAQQDEESRSPGGEQDRGKGSQQKRFPKQKSGTSSDSPLKQALNEAAQRKEEAAIGMKEALLKARLDKRLQSEANREVVAATIRFQQRWQSEADGDAGAGSPRGVKASSSVTSGASAPEGLKQACKRMASFIFSRALSRKSSSKTSSSGAVVEVEGGAVAAGGDSSGQVQSESWEQVLDGILAQLRNVLPGSPEETFRNLDKVGFGAITPMEFTQFLRANVSGIRHQHVGGLWRRGDINCDGQLDLGEFCTLLGPAGSRPPSSLCSPRSESKR